MCKFVQEIWVRCTNLALVLSNNVLNQHCSFVLVSPITNVNKKHPFHAELDERTQTTGVISCDQEKMLDIRARNAQMKEECPEDIWTEERELIISFLRAAAKTQT